MKIRIASVLVLIGLIGAVPVKAEDTEIRFVTEGSYPPFGFMKDGKVVGYEIDIINKMCERIPAKCSISLQSFDGLIPALTAGKYDVILAGMADNEKRRQSIAFSHAYAYNDPILGTMAGSKLANLPGAGKRVPLADKEQTTAAFAAMSDKLAGAKIGAQRGSTTVGDLEANIPSTTSVALYPTMESHNLDLEAGRVDAVWTTVTFIATEQQRGLDIVGTGPVFYTNSNGIAAGLRKEDGELLSKINGALDDLRADGTLKELSMKWFNTDITTRK